MAEAKRVDTIKALILTWDLRKDDSWGAFGTRSLRLFKVNLRNGRPNDLRKERK